MTMILRLFTVLVFTVIPTTADTQIFWRSSQDATNLTSGGIIAMDGGFRFELGVFNSGFVPVPGNISEWAQNWNPAQRTSYKADLRRFADSFLATSNDAPFTAGALAYVWGFKGDPASGEWILFRASNWTWPAEAIGPPDFTIWDAKDATAVIGTINTSGSPSLMRSAGVSNLPPPTTSYSQWVIDELEGESLNAPHEDADGDGEANVFEFIFGTSPKSGNPPTPIPFSVVDVSGTEYLQLSVPRRSDRPAMVVVEVSDNLTNWFSGPSHTVEVTSTTTSLVVRDLTPVSPANPKRFIRVGATVP